MLTALGSVFGTPEYMAPEQARGAAVDSRTDLYTLATVLYEMLTGRTPFAHEQFAQVLMGQISKPPPPLPPEIDEELASLVMQLLEKDPAKRVQTATELFARLHAILARLAPHHPALAGVPAAQAMPSRPSAPSSTSGPSVSGPAPAMTAQPPTPPQPATPVAPATHPAPPADVAFSAQVPAVPTPAVGTTQPRSWVGCFVALVVLVVAAVVLGRWIGTMF